MGDFNIDALDNTHHSTIRLVDLLRSFDLELLVRTPTRVTATTQSAIDNIITNHSSVAVSVVNTAVSDHYGQEAVFIDCLLAVSWSLLTIDLLDAAVDSDGARYLGVAYEHFAVLTL
ncbi:hypothetical protein J6590_102667 [Homalodisca vitripennis]|nr:hypothetical protein J6590_102667 [Homalodisca vitripennis]